MKVLYIILQVVTCIATILFLCGFHKDENGKRLKINNKERWRRIGLLLISAPVLLVAIFSIVRDPEEQTVLSASSLIRLLTLVIQLASIGIYSLFYRVVKKPKIGIACIVLISIIISFAGVIHFDRQYKATPPEERPVVSDTITFNSLFHFTYN